MIYEYDDEGGCGVLDGKQSKGVCVGEQITSPVCVTSGRENGIIKGNRTN
jgi:hypothetical protein